MDWARIAEVAFSSKGHQIAKLGACGEIGELNFRRIIRDHGKAQFISLTFGSC